MEAHLFPRHQLLQDDDEGDEEEGGAKILYRASFKERENALVRYETVQWVLLSLVLLLAWGAGLIMLLYLPFRRYAVRRDVQSRKLYVTTNAIVYKVEKPIFLPCMGVNRREKHILLSLVTDVAIEQGCLQSLYGVHSIKIENASRRKPPPGDDLQIIGVDNPRYLRKVVLMALANLRREQGSSRENNGLKFMDNDQANIEQIPHSPERLPSRNWSWHQGTGLSSWQMAYSANETPRESPFVVAGDIIIKKLDDISKLITRIGFLSSPSSRPSHLNFLNYPNHGLSPSVSCLHGRRAFSEMGNCLILFASDDSFNLLTRLHPFPCESSRTTRCLTTHEYAVDPSHRNLHFDPILPFSTPSDIVPLYELGSQLGRGEFGVVCKCTKRITGQIFACKSISKLQLSTSEETQNIVREATIMQLLSSHGPADGPNLPSGSNVVHLHDIVEDRTSVHLIMDLCSGGDLFDKIAKVKRFPEVQAAHVMKSLLEGLQYCHKKGIIHRDIKPENILLVDDSEQPTIKLADFGLALEFSPGQKFCGVAGSAYYMAPEVLDGEYSVEIDMWSSGVLMYVLLSGVPPFWGNTEQDIFNAIRNGSLDLNSGIWQLISPVAKDLISKMLCVDVKSRCTSSQALKHPWIIRNTDAIYFSSSIEKTKCRNVPVTVDKPSIPKSSILRSCNTFNLKDSDKIQNLAPSRGTVLVNLCDSAALDLEQRNNAELNMLMVTLVGALDREGISLSESLRKLRLQFGCTCTLLTTSATEETLIIDMGKENYLIAHDRRRQILGWKVLKRQRISHTDKKLRSKYPLRKIEAVF